MIDQRRQLSIYIHIPFCRRKCNYCDFLSFGGCDTGVQRDYVKALCKEIRAYSLIAEEYEVVTIFFGGGTPSYIRADYIGMILESVRETFSVSKDAEITIEGNPDSLTRDKLAAYRDYGINRLSIGLQSTNDEMLQTLGRVHNYDQFIAAYSNAREVGFANINIDIMSGLPGESMESYVRTLGKVVELQPEHISAYSLIVEDGTPLAEDEELLSILPSEELDRKQYARTKLLLSRSGYERYEISNYAKLGKKCRHNLVYWTGGEYLGVGLGAASYMKLDISEYDESYADEDSIMDEYYCEQDIDGSEWGMHKWEICDSDVDDSDMNADEINNRGIRDDETDNYKFVRFKGVDNMDEYIGRFLRLGTGFTDISSISEMIGNCYTDIQVLGLKDQMEEFMFLGLRCMRGISLMEFERRFHKKISDVYGSVIEKYVDMGYLIQEQDRLYLSDQGIDVSNTIMAEFLL